MGKKTSSKSMTRKSMKSTKGGIIAVLRPLNPQPEPPGMRKSGGDPQ